MDRRRIQELEQSFEEHKKQLTELDAELEQIKQDLEQIAKIKQDFEQQLEQIQQKAKIDIENLRKETEQLIKPIAISFGVKNLTQESTKKSSRKK